MHARQLEVEEIITLVGNRYLREYLSDAGWARESGMLERRKEQRPVAVERRGRGHPGAGTVRDPGR